MEVTFNDMQEFMAEFWEKMYFRMLVLGNVHQETAIKLIDDIAGFMNPIPAQYEDLEKYKVLDILRMNLIYRFTTYDLKNLDISCITNYYQIG